MARNKKPLPDWDDGRTIADMNAEGMPWYRPARGPETEAGPPREELTKRELRLFTFGAVKAALAVVLAMCAALVAFILFCQFVWFR